jgi:hypothetical protein
MNKNWYDIATDLYVKYKLDGKDANSGGLSFVNETAYPEYKGLLLGFYLNARVAVHPDTGFLARVDIV